MVLPTCACMTTKIWSIALNNIAYEMYWRSSFYATCLSVDAVKRGEESDEYSMCLVQYSFTWNYNCNLLSIYWGIFTLINLNTRKRMTQIYGTTATLNALKSAKCHGLVLAMISRSINVRLKMFCQPGCTYYFWRYVLNFAQEKLILLHITQLC